MEIKDIIKEKYKVARRFYESNKHTTECSYYMGYMDALGELLERIEQEGEKEIPEKLSTWYSVEVKQSDEENIKYANYNFETMYEKINEICDYLKSKGE